MMRSRAGAHQADRGGGRTLAYAAVAVVSLAIGVAGTWLALRSERPPDAAAGGKSAPSAAGHEAMPGMENEAAGEHPTEAKGNTVYISPARQQLIGVRTATVKAQPLRTTIRTVGRLAYDETRVTQINTKISGWIDRVYVDYVGKFVRRGEPLLALYSPALVATQKEYLLALKGGRPLSGSQS